MEILSEQQLTFDLQAGIGVANATESEPKTLQVQHLEIQHADDFADYSLGDLAQRINGGHQGLKIAARRLAGHVAQVGVWLTAAKAKCEHGTWLPWLADNCPEITRMTANKYMRLYDKAVSNVNFSLHLTPTQAYKALGVVREGNDSEWYQIY